MTKGEIEKDKSVNSVAGKRSQARTWVLDRIADGTYKPGQPVLSGKELSRVTGFSAPICRRALDDLVKTGALVHGVTSRARYRVPSTGKPGIALPDAVETLSSKLAIYRRKAGLSQPQLAKLAGRSATAVGHAESGRLWQSRKWWEAVDKALNAGGELVRLHDAYRVAQIPPNPQPRGKQNHGPV